MAILIAISGACAPEKAREFEIGLIGPVSPGVAADARLLGMSVREAPSEGAAAHGAGVAFTGPSGRAEERMADWSHLRLLVGSAAVAGQTGVFFVLPKTPEGRDLTSYPEEWQALARVARETAAIRPILEAGIETDMPFSVPGGVAYKAWRYQGRLYLLLVNRGSQAAAVSGDNLKSWRALFEVRADPRDLLVPCNEGLCLPAERVLWLEGRL